MLPHWCHCSHPFTPLVTLRQSNTNAAAEGSQGLPLRGVASCPQEKPKSYSPCSEGPPPSVSPALPAPRAGRQAHALTSGLCRCFLQTPRKETPACRASGAELGSILNTQGLSRRPHLRDKAALSCPPALSSCRLGQPFQTSLCNCISTARRELHVHTVRS